jgi:hypothetical protein
MAPNANSATSLCSPNSWPARRLVAASPPAGTEAGFAALEQLGVLIEVADQLGPVARRALNAKLRRG